MEDLDEAFFLLVLNIIVINPNLWASEWQPEGKHEQIRIWPDRPPGGTQNSGKAEELKISTEQVGGKNIQYIENVSRPTMTIYPPVGKNTGVAIAVFPGGGHKVIAIDVEGTEVCDWLTESGITCVLVKYRVPHSGCYYDKDLKKHITPKVPMALQDAQRVISMIRYNAKKYGINPSKIGVMGFSAGGNVAILVSTAFKKRSYEPIDEIDKVTNRPDFAIPVFPGHLTMEHKNKTPKKFARSKLNSDISISPEIPPTMLVHAEDDPVNPAYYSAVYARELRKAGVIINSRFYRTGGHAFGVRKQGKDSDDWTKDALVWLNDINVL